MSVENIENITKSNSNSATTFVDYNLLRDITFNGHSLINNIYIAKKVTHLYTSYTLNPWLRNASIDFTLNNCLFGSLKLTKNADSVKHKYSGYNIRFSSWSEFLFADGSMGKNDIIFAADMSPSVHNDN